MKEDNNEGLEIQESLRGTIADNNEKNTDENVGAIPKSFPKKDLIIIIALIAAVVVVFLAITLYALLRDNKDDETIVQQEFSVTIEVFGEKKGLGFNEHEKPNLNKNVYFISEDFKCDENDFKVYLNGSETKFSKKFIFDKEGNYTMTFKFSKEFESLENLFKNCYYITKITFTKINGNKLNDISNMFYNCDGLYEINLDNLDTKNVKSMCSLFEGCSSLESLNLGSNFNSINVLDMSKMFKGCSALKSLDLSNLKTDNVKNFNMMFANANNLID